ncbi:unnamed protein product, partial [marine sediment metagenome]
DLSKKPPEFARLVYNIIEEITGNEDPYKEIKKRDNEHAISLLPEIKSIIKKSEDKLFTSIKIAIAGNIMDFAANSDYDLKKTIEKVLESDFAINDYEKFKEGIKKATSIAYLADNAGEIVFDKLLIEKIRELNNCKIYLFVKGKPIVNDATEIDTKIIGINNFDNIEIKKINTGFPNTGMKKESKEFISFIKQMDLVISKGQGNYESLSEVNANIYFLLIAKCHVIARDLGVKKGSIILKSNKHGGR